MINDKQQANNQYANEKVVIIIPTYNEGLVIENTITQVFAAAELIEAFDIHILIFDSASQDNTQEVVNKLQATYPKLYLQKEPQKTGLGSAYLQAMHYALSALGADIVFEFDADLSHQPKYLKPILEQLKTCDAVVGSRYVKGGSIPADWGFHRKLLSVLGNYMARAVLTPKYKDITSGFRATRRAILKKVLPAQFLSNQYAYKLELLWLLHKNKAKITEYPIDFIDREKGDSKLPKNSIVDSLRVIFTLRYLELKRFLKMCIVGSVGLGVQFLVFNLLRQHMSAFNASQIAVGAAIINNYLLNSQFTFKNPLHHKRTFKFRRLVDFVAYSVFMIYAQSSVLQLGIHFFGDGPLRENILLGVSVALGSYLNYFTYSRRIWPELKTLQS